MRIAPTRQRGRSGRGAAAVRRHHWETIYRTRGEEALSWHQDEPSLSLRLISRVALRSARIVDVGGGSSPLAERLRGVGYRHITVIDVSRNALDRNRVRSAAPGRGIRYRPADITRVRTLGRFDVWHDRALFHFLTDSRDRAHYVDLAARTVPVGGHLVMASFSRDGPDKCSGLPVVRYDPADLADEFGPRFALRSSHREEHRTPWGALQPFTYAVLERVRARKPVREAQRAPTE